MTKLFLQGVFIGHTRFTPGYLLKGEEPPSCLTYQTKMAVKHILSDCTVFNVNRQRFCLKFKGVFN